MDGGSDDGGAPNLTAIVGSDVAAKLMDTAGGLSALAKMKARDIQIDHLEHTDIFKTTPPAFKMRARRVLAAKSALAAMVDSVRGDPTGKTGRNLREQILMKIVEWQEPPTEKQPKQPLPGPVSEPKRKRGGLRLRKMKERQLNSQILRCMQIS